MLTGFEVMAKKKKKMLDVIPKILQIPLYNY